MFGFEKLDVWKKAVESADHVYRMTREFPDYEKFGLANQVRRSVVSISSNIAEGSSREPQRDFARSIEIAYGSTIELVSQIHIAQRQEFMPTEDARELHRSAKEVARMPSGLRSSLQRSQ